MTLILTPRVLVPQWIERPPSVRVVTGSIPAEDSDFALSQACVVLISSLISSFFVVSLSLFPSPVDGPVLFLGWENGAGGRFLNSCEQFTAPFNNKRTPKLKAQSTNAFFATGSSLLPTTVEHCSVVCIMLNDLISTRSAVVGVWEEPRNI